MKKLIAFTAMIFLFSIGWSQTTFEIKSLGSNYSTQQIEQAFGSADFCGFFYQGKRNIITLDDGAVIELLGKDENNALSASCVKEDDFEYPSAVWSISASGKVMRKMDVLYPKKQ